MQDLERVEGNQLVLASSFGWSASVSHALAELLLEGHTIIRALELLSVKYAYVSQEEGTKYILDAGGVASFIYREIPDVTREQIARMQKLYLAQGKPLRRGERRTAIERSTLAKLATMIVYDNDVEVYFEKLLREIKDKKELVLPYAQVLRSRSLSRDEAEHKGETNLIPTLTIRLIQPPKRGKKYKIFWLIAARLMQEISELEEGTSDFKDLLVVQGLRKIVLVIIERKFEQKREFVAIESTFLAQLPLLT